MLFFKKKTDILECETPEFEPKRFTIHRSEGYLAGQLLVSTPLITSSCFHRSVVYLFAHNGEGAMGIIVNQPLETVGYNSLLDENDIPAAQQSEEISVYYGGPVDRTRGFVIHTDDYNKGETLIQGNGIAVSANTGILRDMLHEQGPQQSLLIVGYAGWAAGQLEQEIEENSWITVPASPSLIFATENDMKWTMASQSLGIDMNFFSHTVGHA